MLNLPKNWQFLRMLRVRIVLWTVSLEAILMLAFAIILVFILQNNRNQQINETLRLSALQLNAVVEINNNSVEIPEEEVRNLEQRGIVAWIFTPDSNIATSLGQVADLSFPTERPAIDTFTEAELAEGESFRIWASSLQEENHLLGIFYVAISLREEFSVIQELQLSLVVTIPIILIFSAIGGLILANRAISPVAAITETVQQISATDLTKRVNLDLPEDEIGDLAHTFNEMLERLDYAFQRERQFTSDVSHELRTPLSLLKTQLSLARSRPRSQSELMEMMVAMEEDVNRMTRLIEQMLTLARTENHDLAQMVKVDLTSVVLSLVEAYRPLAEAQNLLLKIEIPANQDFTIQGIPQLLQQVLANLLDNALKYTPAQGIVSIQLLREGESILLRVEDNGQGIAPEHLPRLFQRFYRVDSARSREAGGFGLGLAISKAIILAHGGSIEIESQIHHGTVVLIHLPSHP